MDSNHRQNDLLVLETANKRPMADSQIGIDHKSR